MDLTKKSFSQRLFEFFRTDKPFYILFLFAILLRVELLMRLGYNSLLSVNDSFNYLDAGIVFAHTGKLTYGGQISALIMPGITVLTGAMCRIFGEGEAFLWAVEILWMSLGVCTMIYLYKAANVLLPKFYSLPVAAVYLFPMHVCIDSYLMTEGPFFLFFAMSLYYMLKMGKELSVGNAVGFGVSVLAGMMFRANILTLAVLALLYLFMLGRYSLREILSRALIVCAVLAVFIIPWTIRNYHYYDAFVPVTYGAGNPVLDGTYQNDLYPVEDAMDWSVPEARFNEQYGRYYDENGNLLKPEAYQYLQHMYNGIAADYRIEMWFKLAPAHFLKTYFIDKPRMVLNCPWDWTSFGVIQIQLRRINFVLCGLAFILAFIKKQYRAEVTFLLLAYIIGLYMVSFSCTLDRYAEAVMPYRYLTAGIGFYLICDSIKAFIDKKQKTGTGL